MGNLRDLYKDTMELAEKDKVVYTPYYQNCWESLREFLKEYHDRYRIENRFEERDGRYCVAISIEDLLEKMDEIENGN